MDHSENFSVKLQWMPRFQSFLLWNCTTVCWLHLFIWCYRNALLTQFDFSVCLGSNSISHWLLIPAGQVFLHLAIGHPPFVWTPNSDENSYQFSLTRDINVSPWRLETVQSEVKSKTKSRVVNHPFDLPERGILGRDWHSPFLQKHHHHTHHRYHGGFQILSSITAGSKPG